MRWSSRSAQCPASRYRWCWRSPDWRSASPIRRAISSCGRRRRPGRRGGFSASFIPAWTWARSPRRFCAAGSWTTACRRASSTSCSAARSPPSSPCSSYRRDSPLYSVLDTFSVQHAKERRPILVAAGAIRSVELLGAGLRRLLGHELHVVQAARHRIDLDLAGAVHVIHHLERAAHRLAERKQAVVAQDHRMRLLAEIAGHARLLLFVQRDALVVVIGDIGLHH